MFAETLKNEAWQDSMPGISVCNLTDNDSLGDLSLHMAPAHAEVFFCTGGSMTITRMDGSQVTLEPREILLVSSCSDMKSAVMTEPLQGLFLAVDQSLAGESLKDLSKFMDVNVSMKQVGEKMRAGGGFRTVQISPWSRGVFYALRRVPRADQASYCILKTLELLYLISVQEQEGTLTQRDQAGSFMNVAASMKDYMEQHMDEKLTITDLSHRFHMSRTACKSAFRSCYGQPIHAWLLDRRMEKAAELLEKTKLPILQVAQSVGYTGVSQFNVAFRQRYGKSPREYRKMSISVAF